MQDFKAKRDLYAQEKHLRPQTLRRWDAWGEKDREALWNLVSELKMGENHLRDFLDWLEEIQVRDGRNPAEVLEEKEIQSLLSRPLSRQDKLKEIKRTLRKMRYPQLSRLEEHLKEAARKIERGGRVRVVLPPFLEGSELTLEIHAKSPQELKNSLEDLLLRMDEVERLFKLLDEV